MSGMHSRPPGMMTFTASRISTFDAAAVSNRLASRRDARWWTGSATALTVRNTRGEQFVTGVASAVR
jgi:hypothetical protein